MLSETSGNNFIHALIDGRTTEDQHKVRDHQSDGLAHDDHESLPSNHSPKVLDGDSVL